MTPPELDVKTWLSFSSIAAAISVFGTLTGLVLKEHLFTRSFERWKQKQTLNQIYQKFRDPLLLSARDLSSRTVEILNQYPTVYLNEHVLTSHPQKQIKNNISDPYFQRYKLISTAYRLSALLSWVELYRQEITFLHPGNNKSAETLEKAVENIRSDLADGQLNKADNWANWKDILIFREELRAIGESLIETRGSNRTVMGYGRYCEQLEADSVNSVQQWATPVFNFFLELEVSGTDFRHVRLKRLLVHVVDLMRLLDDKKIDCFLEEKYQEIFHEANA
ncbi:hypothetical protein [Uliginosibacterium gangwonense]|uniref:hypothetical protein n=1 Tax=Uliginosibacterium gangwonense TaxID=392736 RepID=UPI00037A6B85|nr:hypothetical protein [Uliginosibacterium gangwonense]